MKTKILFSVLLAIAFSFQINAQIKVLSNGNVGIGNSNPTSRLDVQGPVRFGQWLGCCNQTWEQVIIDWNNQWSAPMLYPASDAQFSIGKSTNRVGNIFTFNIIANNFLNGSDENMKENIQPLSSTLSRLRKVNGKMYNFKRLKGVNLKMPINTDKKTFGFIAQELKNIFPELVQEPDSMNPNYSVNYIGMIPVLVEAFKEQQTQIDNLQKLAFSQEQDIIELKKQVALIKNGNNAQIKSAKMAESPAEITLYQNIPNPFNQSTQIEYFIPNATQNATLYIYDMNGLQIKSFLIQTKGSGSVTISGSELRPGMYIYTLIADGKEVDTKRMILTQ